MNKQHIICLILAVSICCCKSNVGKVDLVELFELSPQNGFLSREPASKWEESAISGNGTVGMLIPGHVHKDRIVLSHEKLFMPEYEPLKAPNLSSRLDEIRTLIFNGKEKEASMIAVEEGKQIGIEDEFVWTNPHIPACQLEFQAIQPIKNDQYARTVNYETGEVTVNYGTEKDIISRKAFVSRKDNVAVFQITSPTGGKLNYRFLLNQLPQLEAEEDEEVFDPTDYTNLNISAEKNYLSYQTTFKKEWQGSLKSYTVLTKIINKKGSIRLRDNALEVIDADEILVLSTIKLSYDKSEGNQIETLKNELDVLEPSYDKLLAPHAKIHGEMFNRFSFELGENESTSLTSNELLASSSFENTNKDLIVQSVKAGRYNVISSTGATPPSLQGIWGGTWRPAWSGDFTLNGNVPSAIALGLNTNYQELTDAYLNMLDSMMDDFKYNASAMYGLEGIYVPSRVSEFGSAYHFAEFFPHLYWYAGTAWAAHFHYDRWLYTMDEQYLKERALPFMLEAYDFLSQILYKTRKGEYMFIPSYSPEVGPLGKHPVAINATMDVAAMKQLLRNLIALAKQGYIAEERISEYENILKSLPEYAIDKKGELKEWIWDSYENNNDHRHVSHLYPLYDGVDPDFKNNERLLEAARKAIEARMFSRRENDGGIMAFGLVQLGMASAHLKNAVLAEECVNWLVNSYWTTAFVSYHDPQEIFNMDISGGLPAVVSYMLLQSTLDGIELLPALPKNWPNGKVKGLPARGGFVVDMEWKDGKPSKVLITSKSGRATKIKFRDQVIPIQVKKGRTQEVNFI
ncbi:glycoside hydrolase N-terminal domain-containing protein [Flagellimonas sp. CMM7]|uniref:glycosyl hydrolase family 95 catalytic domain-containing protein n=1 Tax=Flagellimonas sp. CMM7 TaxID=2654676 RepID=UPI0013D258A1|nr:glycoside hydrolase N-terminal domain-containing protein [Flagellimonas sp. CMM7]UII79865.1 glycoside hydrolase family 95 protein [Flagellimonas sp. CMM7]